MTLAHYGKARRGTAGITGKQRRVPDKPYWEDLKDDEDPDETVGGKSDSAPSTPSKSPKKRAQILETKSPSASTLSRRSRRRKRPRNEADEGTESFGDCLSTIGDGGINLDISSSPTKSKSPSKKGNAKSLEIPKLNLRRLDSPKAGKKKDSRKEETENEVRDKPPLELEMHIGENRLSPSSRESAPVGFQEALEQLPRLESMLSGIHAALKLQGGSLQSHTKSNGSPSDFEAVFEMHRSIEARQEESIKRLEALCEKQSKAFDELVKQMEEMQANHEKERSALSKEVETLRAVGEGFDKQQSSNGAILKKMEKLEARLSDKQEEQQNYSNQLLEMASNSKKQDIFLLERNVKIQELMEESSKAKTKYEGKIKELSTALRKSEAKVLELETENQQFKNMLDSFQASLTSATTEAKDPPAPQSPKTPKNQPKSPKNQPKSPSATADKSEEESSPVTKRQTRSARKAIPTALPLSFEHANIIELPSSPPFDSNGRYKGAPIASPSKTRASPSRSKSTPSRSSRSKKPSSSSNSIGSSSTGRRRLYTKVPVPTFDSLSGINPG